MCNIRLWPVQRQKTSVLTKKYIRFFLFQEDEIIPQFHKEHEHKKEISVFLWTRKKIESKKKRKAHFLLLLQNT